MPTIFETMLASLRAAHAAENIALDNILTDARHCRARIAQIESTIRLYDKAPLPSTPLHAETARDHAGEMTIVTKEETQREIVLNTWATTKRPRHNVAKAAGVDWPTAKAWIDDARLTGDDRARQGDAARYHLPAQTKQTTAKLKQELQGAPAPAEPAIEAFVEEALGPEIVEPRHEVMVQDQTVETIMDKFKADLSEDLGTKPVQEPGSEHAENTPETAQKQADLPPVSDLQEKPSFNPESRQIAHFLAAYTAKDGDGDFLSLDNVSDLARGPLGDVNLDPKQYSVLFRLKDCQIYGVNTLAKIAGARPEDMKPFMVKLAARLSLIGVQVKYMTNIGYSIARA